MNGKSFWSLALDKIPENPESWKKTANLFELQNIYLLVAEDKRLSKMIFK